MKSEMSKFQEVGQIPQTTHRRITEDNPLLVGHVPERPVAPAGAQTTAYTGAGPAEVAAEPLQTTTYASTQPEAAAHDTDQEAFTVRREDMIDTSEASAAHDGQDTVVEFGQNTGTDGGEMDIEADLQRQIDQELADADFGNGRARAANS